MMERKINNKRGQAIVELAIFGSIIFIVFGALLSYIQSMNDQQYNQMEAFRRSLEKACNYAPASGGAGASVQMTYIENRRYTEAQESGFRKGTPSTSSASSSIFWAVPEVGAQSESLLSYRINQDEKTWNYGTDAPFASAGDNKSVGIEDINTQQDTYFSEDLTKNENQQRIATTKESTLKDTVTTNLTYAVREKDADGSVDPDSEPIATDELWSVTQNLYRDTDGQYKYSNQANTQETDVRRTKTWETPF